MVLLKNIIPTLLVLFILVSCNALEEDDETQDTSIETQTYTDGQCDGAAVGQSPNDTDNTFLSLVVHPSDPNTVMIGNEGNGIFKSTDGGTTWSRKRNGIRYIKVTGYCFYTEIYDVIYDAGDANQLFTVTTGGPRSANEEGVGGFYYSTDGGDEWSRSVSGMHNQAVIAIAQDKLNTNTLYVGMDNGMSTGSNPVSLSGSVLYKSTDAGLNWNPLTLPVTDNRIRTVVVDPTNSNYVYCAGYDEKATTDYLSSSHLGFARSTDGGSTWTKINNGLASLYHGQITIDPQNPSVLYGFVWNNQGAQAYKSTDRGDNWSAFPPNGSLAGINYLKVSPHDSNTLIAFTALNLYISTDDGTSWSQTLDISNEPYGTGFRDIEFSGNSNIIYVSANQLKVYRSTDGGQSFTATSSIQSLIGH